MAASSRCRHGRTVLGDHRNFCKTFTLRAGAVFGKSERITALSNISLSIPAGATIGLVGESGSGKTTLSKIIMRAMKPDAGTDAASTTARGCATCSSLRGSELKAYRRAVQFVFQDPFSSLDPRMTVYDILAEPLADPRDRHARRTIPARQGSAGARGARPALDAALPALVLRRPAAAHRPGAALALNPSVILCDEPTSALDVSVQAQILNLLKDLQNALGLSYLFVSHNLAVVDYMASEIAVMCRGIIVEQAPRRQPVP